MATRSEHGTPARYSYGCRCLPCRWAKADECRIARQNRKAAVEAGEVEVIHGRASTYRNWGCCCDACRQAAYVDEKRRKALHRYEAIFPRVLRVRIIPGFMPIHPIRTASFTIFLPPTPDEIERCQDVLLTMLGLTDAFLPLVEWSVCAPTSG